MPGRLIQFGRIWIEALPRWSFFPLETQVVARPHTRVGAMKISLRHVDGMPPPRTHAESFSIAQDFLEDPHRSQPSHMEQGRRGNRLVGSADYTTEDCFYRLWYVHEQDCLVSAVYGCKFTRRREPATVSEIMDAHRIISSLEITGIEVMIPAAAAVSDPATEQHA